MSVEKPKVKRKAVSKKLRFEVFKRDSFTCQYCGKKAPDVVLHIEHITPVSKGGKNTMMNLVTSCVECNLGKGARELSDSSALTVGRRQAEDLQQRREQIEMLRDWHIGLVSVKDQEFNAVDDLFKVLTGGEFCIAESARPETEKLIKQFGLGHVLESLREGATGYKDAVKALNKLGGICACRNDPTLKRKSYILGTFRNKVGHWDAKKVSVLVSRGIDAGGEEFLSQLEAWAVTFRGTWTKFITGLTDAVSEYEGAA